MVRLFPNSPLLRCLVVLLATLIPTTSLAEIIIADAYARVSRPNAPTGAIFMEIRNTGDAPMRLVAVRSDVAKRIELHEHVKLGDGIVSMQEIEGGIEIKAGGQHRLARGGDHIMLMGIAEPLQQGQIVAIELVFESSETVAVGVPVDNERKPHQAGSHGHN